MSESERLARIEKIARLMIEPLTDTASPNLRERCRAMARVGVGIRAILRECRGEPDDGEFPEEWQRKEPAGTNEPEAPLWQRALEMRGQRRVRGHESRVLELFRVERRRMTAVDVTELLGDVLPDVVRTVLGKLHKKGKLARPAHGTYELPAASPGA